MNADFIIVGQGIAGTVLAHRLEEYKQRVVVISHPSLSASSAVAAGIWNPIVFKRLTKSWMADEILPELHAFYGSCGHKLHQNFLSERAIIKPFTEAQEATLWQKKSAEGNQYLDGKIYSDFDLSEKDHATRYSKVLEAGNLHMQEFLERSREYFISGESYLEDNFEFESLSTTPDGVSYKHIRARYIVFCEGHLVRKNPFFGFIPMKPAKGEVLTIHCKGIRLEKDIFNKNLFIMPLGNDLYKVGATYAWDKLNDFPTDEGKEELLAKLQQILTIPFEIIHHQAGVRPSVIDRRPVLGKHASNERVAIFNGLGTKGVMLAPYFSGILAEHLIHGQPVPAEVDINRF